MDWKRNAEGVVMGNVVVISPGQAGTTPILAEVKRHPLALAMRAARGLRWWLGEKLVKAPAPKFRSSFRGICVRAFFPAASASLAFQTQCADGLVPIEKETSHVLCA